MNSVYVARFEWSKTPLWLAASEQALLRIEFGRSVSFDDFKESLNSATLVDAENNVLKNASQQLHDYFDKKLQQFSIKVDFLHGTPFQKSVWRAVEKIPFGATASYGQIAKNLSNPGAVRAVGAANGANPVPIFIPCHRVVQSDGKLGGYGGGLDVKDALLRLEGALI